MSRPLFLLILLVGCTFTKAADLSDASNFRHYSDTLSSSGQPSAAQLKDAAEKGFERIIYLAFTDNDSAIEDEDRLVKQLNMDYVHIPVDFDNPTLLDFKTFVGAMGEIDTARTLVHCQVNFRASTFSFLYRVAIEGVPILDAKEDYDSVWAPNEIWFRFIRTVLDDYELNHQCEGCDWGEHDFIDE
jgi:protein tyrosine phosphatase (PTP) superfamily phosphohydrolase (DUF442 family)